LLFEQFVSNLIIALTEFTKRYKLPKMIRKGTEVKWKWGQGYATGKVENTYSESITKTIKGNEVTRNGSSENKALLIKQEDGAEVLKLESEVERVD